MKEIEIPSGKYLLVQVPEHSNGFQIEPRWGMLVFYKGEPSFENMSDRELPGDNWQIVGKANELSLSDKTSIVEHENDKSGHLRSWWYKNYEGVDEDRWLKSPAESFKTLLTANNMESETTLILRQISK